MQQALQYGVAVAQEARVFQCFGLVYTVVRSSRSNKGPAFANATVDDTAEVSNSAHCRHGCIRSGLLVVFVASGYSSKDQLCRIALVWGSIDGCVVVCKSRTCGQQSMLWCKKRRKISASKKERSLKEEMWKSKSRRHASGKEEDRRTHFVFLLFHSIVRLLLGRPSIRLMAFPYCSCNDPHGCYYNSR